MDKLVKNLTEKHVAEVISRYKLNTLDATLYRASKFFEPNDLVTLIGDNAVYGDIIASADINDITTSQLVEFNISKHFKLIPPLRVAILYSVNCLNWLYTLNLPTVYLYNGDGERIPGMIKTFCH